MFLTQTIIKRSKINATTDDLFNWCIKRESFRRSLPPTLKIKILEEGEKRIKFLLPLGPLCALWIFARKEDGFSLQHGPFVSFEHRCQFTSNHLSEIEDRIEYRLPCHYLGYLFGNRFVQKKLRALLNHRHSVLKHDIECFHRYPKTELHIVIAGGSGFIGTHLTTFLRLAGHRVSLLTRKKNHELYWDPEKGIIPSLENCDAVINLSGENIASFWTKKKKKNLYDSRVNTTRFLVSALNSLTSPPKVFLSTSAVHGDEKGFLSNLCAAWEKEALAFKGHTAIMRFGIVLSPDGGALKRMLPIFKAGLGGPLGSGQQMMSWIALDDLLYQLYHLLMTPSQSGTFNFTAPNPVTNREFSTLLSKQLHRPSFFKIPAFLLKMLFGQMAKEVFLPSIKAYPDSHAHFAYPNLPSALVHFFPRKD